jgi:hypothetical protein
MMKYLFIFGGLAVVVGVALISISFQERGLAETASKTPEGITLKELIARGPDGNPNIVLKDFMVCQNYVFESRGTVWQRAWVPVVPVVAAGKGGERPNRPDVIRAVIYSSEARSEDDLYRRCEQPKLRGLVTNRIAALGSRERNLLEKEYPGTDFTKCLIIHESRELSGSSKVMGMLVGGGAGILIGVILVVLGVVVWFTGRREPRAYAPRRRDDWR